MMGNSSGGLTFTIIIPVWPDNERPIGMDYVDKIDWPKDRIEAVLARGLSPCRQRNEAAKVATGDVLVFFDDDSCPEPNYLKCLAPHFADSEIAGVCGPNPAVPTDKYIPNLVEAIFTSRMGVLSKRARYKPVGKLREAGDSDIIFCNFAIRRELYLQLNGLDERLCPNEDNEFLERLGQQFPDKKLLYDPQVIAREPRPETMRLLLRKIYGYGRGRARQFKVRPSLWSSVHVLGCLLIVLPALLFLKWGLEALLYLLVPYAVLLLVSTVYCLMTNKRRSLALGIGVATFAVHIAYVLGLWKGLFESTAPPDREQTHVKIEYYNISSRSHSEKEL